MKTIIATTLVALALAAPAVAQSVHNDTAQKIFDQIRGEDGAGATK